MYIYGASKAQTEQEMWKWVRENKPGFAFNAILPNRNFGKILRPDKQGYPSTPERLKMAFEARNIEFLAKVVLPRLSLPVPPIFRSRSRISQRTWFECSIGARKCI